LNFNGEIWGGRRGKHRERLKRGIAGKENKNLQKKVRCNARHAQKEKAKAKTDCKETRGLVDPIGVKQVLNRRTYWGHHQVEQSQDRKARKTFFDREKKGEALGSCLKEKAQEQCKEKKATR